MYDMTHYVLDEFLTRNKIVLNDVLKIVDRFLRKNMANKDKNLYIHIYIYICMYIYITHILSI